MNSFNQELSIKLLDESPSNPRKVVETRDDEELAQSIRSKGVLQPIRVRPLKRGRYEIVFGHRRMRAARLAGLATVPATIADMTDLEVLEAQIVENENRADVSPLEKAAGYGALIEKHGVSLEAVAARVGKSVSTVRGLLRLRSLPPKATKAVADGTLPASTAGLIARVPTEPLRERVTHCVLSGTAWHNPNNFLMAKLSDFGPADDSDGGILSYRETKDLIEDCCLVELKGAPFDRQSLDLVPAAGNCEACPKRGGNLAKAEPDEYEGLRANVCTDPGCYQAKATAHQEQLRRKLKDEGKKVLAGKQAKELFPYGRSGLAYNAPYVELKNCCQEDKKLRTYQTLVGKELADDVVYAEDSHGELHALLPKDKAKKELKKKFGIGASSNGHSPGRSAITSASTRRSWPAKRP